MRDFSLQTRLWSHEQSSRGTVWLDHYAHLSGLLSNLPAHIVEARDRCGHMEAPVEIFYT